MGVGGSTIYYADITQNTFVFGGGKPTDGLATIEGSRRRLSREEGSSPSSSSNSSGSASSSSSTARRRLSVDAEKFDPLRRYLLKCDDICVLKIWVNAEEEVPQPIIVTPSQPPKDVLTTLLFAAPVGYSVTTDMARWGRYPSLEKDFVYWPGDDFLAYEYFESRGLDTQIREFSTAVEYYMLTGTLIPQKRKANLSGYHYYVITHTTTPQDYAVLLGAYSLDRNIEVTKGSLASTSSTDGGAIRLLGDSLGSTVTWMNDQPGIGKTFRNGIKSYKGRSEFYSRRTLQEGDSPILTGQYNLHLNGDGRHVGYTFTLNSFSFFDMASNESPSASWRYRYLYWNRQNKLPSFLQSQEQQRRRLIGSSFSEGKPAITSHEPHLMEYELYSRYLQQAMKLDEAAPLQYVHLGGDIADKLALDHWLVVIAYFLAFWMLVYIFRYKVRPKRSQIIFEGINIILGIHDEKLQFIRTGFSGMLIDGFRALSKRIKDRNKVVSKYAVKGSDFAEAEQDLPAAEIVIQKQDSAAALPKVVPSIKSELAVIITPRQGDEAGTAEEAAGDGGSKPGSTKGGETASTGGKDTASGTGGEKRTSQQPSQKVGESGHPPSQDSGVVRSSQKATGFMKMTAESSKDRGSVQIADSPTTASQSATASNKMSMRGSQTGMASPKATSTQKPTGSTKVTESQKPTGSMKMTGSQKVRASSLKLSDAAEDSSKSDAGSKAEFQSKSDVLFKSSKQDTKDNTSHKKDSTILFSSPTGFSLKNPKSPKGNKSPKKGKDKGGKLGEFGDFKLREKMKKGRVKKGDAVFRTSLVGIPEENPLSPSKGDAAGLTQQLAAEIHADDALLDAELDSNDIPSLVSLEPADSSILPLFNGDAVLHPKVTPTDAERAALTELQKRRLAMEKEEQEAVLPVVRPAHLEFVLNLNPGHENVERKEIALRESMTLKAQLSMMFDEPPSKEKEREAEPPHVTIAKRVFTQRRSAKRPATLAMEALESYAILGTQNVGVGFSRPFTDERPRMLMEMLKKHEEIITVRSVPPEPFDGDDSFCDVPWQAIEEPKQRRLYKWKLKREAYLEYLRTTDKKHIRKTDEHVYKPFMKYVHPRCVVCYNSCRENILPFDYWSDVFLFTACWVCLGYQLFRIFFGVAYLWFGLVFFGFFLTCVVCLFFYMLCIRFSVVYVYHTPLFDHLRAVVKRNRKIERYRAQIEFEDPRFIRKKKEGIADAEKKPADAIVDKDTGAAAEREAKPDDPQNIPVDAAGRKPRDSVEGGIQKTLDIEENLVDTEEKPVHTEVTKKDDTTEPPAEGKHEAEAPDDGKRQQEVMSVSSSELKQKKEKEEVKTADETAKSQNDNETINIETKASIPVNLNAEKQDFQGSEKKDGNVGKDGTAIEKDASTGTSVAVASGKGEFDASKGNEGDFLKKNDEDAESIAVPLPDFIDEGPNEFNDPDKVLMIKLIEEKLAQDDAKEGAKSKGNFSKVPRLSLNEVRRGQEADRKLKSWEKIEAIIGAIPERIAILPALIFAMYFSYGEIIFPWLFFILVFVLPTTWLIEERCIRDTFVDSGVHLFFRFYRWYYENGVLQRALKKSNEEARKKLDFTNPESTYRINRRPGSPSVMDVLSRSVETASVSSTYSPINVESYYPAAPCQMRVAVPMEVPPLKLRPLMLGIHEAMMFKDWNSLKDDSGPVAFLDKIFGNHYKDDRPIRHRPYDEDDLDSVSSVADSLATADYFRGGLAGQDQFPGEFSEEEDELLCSPKEKIDDFKALMRHCWKKTDTLHIQDLKEREYVDWTLLWDILNFGLLRFPLFSIRNLIIDNVRFFRFSPEHKFCWATAMNRRDPITEPLGLVEEARYMERKEEAKNEYRKKKREEHKEFLKAEAIRLAEEERQRQIAAKVQKMIDDEEAAKRKEQEAITKARLARGEITKEGAHAMMLEIYAGVKAPEGDSKGLQSGTTGIKGSTSGVAPSEGTRRMGVEGEHQTPVEGDIPGGGTEILKDGNHETPVPESPDFMEYIVKIAMEGSHMMPEPESAASLAPPQMPETPADARADETSVEIGMKTPAREGRVGTATVQFSQQEESTPNKNPVTTQEKTDASLPANRYAVTTALRKDATMPVQHGQVGTHLAPQLDPETPAGQTVASTPAPMQDDVSSVDTALVEIDRTVLGPMMTDPKSIPATAMRFLREIRKLQLSEVFLVDNTFELIMDSFGFHAAKPRRELTLADISQSDSMLLELHVTANCLTDKSALYLARLLAPGNFTPSSGASTSAASKPPAYEGGEDGGKEQDAKLLALSIGGSKIGHAAKEVLSKQRSLFPYLRELHIWSNRLGPNGIITLMKAFATMPNLHAHPEPKGLDREALLREANRNLKEAYEKQKEEAKKSKKHMVEEEDDHAYYNRGNFRTGSDGNDDDDENEEGDHHTIAGRSDSVQNRAPPADAIFTNLVKTSYHNLKYANEGPPIPEDLQSQTDSDVFEFRRDQPEFPLPGAVPDTDEDTESVASFSYAHQLRREQNMFIGDDARATKKIEISKLYSVGNNFFLRNGISCFPEICECLDKDPHLKIQLNEGDLPEEKELYSKYPRRVIF